MFTGFARKILNTLPFNLRNSLKSLRNKIIKRSIIARWERSGRPIPPPHQVKQRIIELYRLLSGFMIFIETGTMLGDMVDAEKRHFQQIYSVELGEKLWKNAVRRFKNYEHIKIIQGDSAQVLGDIMKQIDQPAIFWLDAHYSSGITVKGDKDCPIFGEIDAIFRYKRLNHILLVDDARHFTGQGDYPTIEALTRYIRGKDEKYQVEVKDDIIRYTV